MNDVLHDSRPELLCRRSTGGLDSRSLILHGSLDGWLHGADDTSNPAACVVEALSDRNDARPELFVLVDWYATPVRAGLEV